MVMVMMMVEGGLFSWLSWSGTMKNREKKELCQCQRIGIYMVNRAISFLARYSLGSWRVRECNGEELQ